MLGELTPYGAKKRLELRAPSDLIAQSRVDYREEEVSRLPIGDRRCLGGNRARQANSGGNGP